MGEKAAETHVPVLYREVLTGLQVRPGGRYIDATIGAGGHASGILDTSAPDGRLLGLDADPEAVTFARRALQRFGDRAIITVSNFRDLQAAAVAHGFEQVDGVIMDLGFSSRQLGAAERGFSFEQDGPLDMRLNPNQGRTAAELIQDLSEMELADLFWRYGEERYSRRIARAIVGARPVTTTRQLAELITKRVGRREKIHPATRVFQALRIAVNDELGALAEALPQARNLLRPGGRLAVIAFHSLEDRLVKQFYQQEARDCICPPDAPVCVCGHRATLSIVTRKPIRPSGEEVSRNPRSRSARLRIAYRTPGVTGQGLGKE
ncbi:MAG: 16S rRNA (cytosine(1402)-N(4))-methyltransferase RsmH [Anaerolineae bacterium]|nr:16S rRNA (cytosine(1402)-N(4))-methyltransferase RsmH [Anaerolineae bacterium]